MTIDVTSITNHEDFISTKNGNDIAILELAEEVDLTTYTPACMAKTSDTPTFDGKNAWAYGEKMIIWLDLIITYEVWPRLGDNILWRKFIWRVAGGGGPRGD